jgi:2-polyprenyl-6-methoxyphenol hydroxylase-like FAD-dependent oxidoreductase
MAPTKTEVLVIGGGPAGSTFGTFMGMRGHEATLLGAGGGSLTLGELTPCARS